MALPFRKQGQILYLSLTLRKGREGGGRSFRSNKEKKGKSPVFTPEKMGRDVRPLFVALGGGEIGREIQGKAKDFLEGKRKKKKDRVSRIMKKEKGGLLSVVLQPPRGEEEGKRRRSPLS